MSANLVKRVTKELIRAVGISNTYDYPKNELLESTSPRYSPKTVEFFIEDLLIYARKHDLTLIVNELSVSEFNALLRVINYPVLYFEQQGPELVAVIGGKDLQGHSLAISLADVPASYQPTEGVKKPVLFSNHPKSHKNGQVIFLTTFPMEPLVSNPETLHKEEHHHPTPVQRLLRLLGNERKDIGYIYFYAIVVGLISLVLPLGVQAIFNLVSSGMVFSSVYVLMGLVLVGLIGSSYMQIIQVTLVEILQRRIFTKAAFEFTYRLPRFKSESLFDTHPPELMNRFFDVLTVQKALPKFLIDITAATLQILFGLLLLSFYHPFFIAFSFLIILAFFGIVALQGRKGLEASIKESKYKYRVVAWLEDIAGTLYSFKMAGSTNLPIQKMDTLLNNYLNYRAKHFKILKGFYYYALVFKTLVIGGLLVLGTYLLVDRQISLGQFVASEIVIVLLTAAVEKLFLSIDIIFDLLTAVDKLGHVTDLPLEKEGGHSFGTLPRAAGLDIKATNLSYQYPESARVTLKNINLSVEAGERVCITGQNGSGKNTLARILAGILTNYEGSLRYNGISMRDLDTNLLHNVVEMNFPGEDIFDGTILENITMGRAGITMDDVQRVLNQFNLSDDISQLPLGLDTPLVSAGRHFALSFITKISLARLTINMPKLLIINDKSRSLEQSERERVIEIFTNPDHKWTLLVISDEPDFISACDRVVVLEKGEIHSNQDLKSLKKLNIINTPTAS
ncbi:MAG: ATP-binding cassette domain-containing protein [Runella slithyformis]|nr:MAG: ATP-binding cassette domain-containing protein [Runella slithyformis]TAF79679.1 MAG: ATP-binding cassette domain-containing protein [Runella slithyformis]